jgi:hypothetical protein
VVEDFLFDDETWAIRYLSVDARTWPLGRHVLVSPESIQEVEWGEKTLRLRQSCEHIMQGSRFEPRLLPLDPRSGKSSKKR